MSIYDVFGGSKPFNKEEWAGTKTGTAKGSLEMIDNTCAEMLADGDAFGQYLEVQGRFDRYSVNNAILVSAQMSEATSLKDKNAWKQSRVYVNKDAQKVIILEPGKEYTREDGTRQSVTMQKKFMIFPILPQQTDSRRRKRRECVSLYRQ